MIVTVLMFVKNLTFITVFMIRKFIDNTADPPMRPYTGQLAMNKVEKEAFDHIQGYLIDPHDDGVDQEGNTTMHQLMKYEEDLDTFIDRMKDLPHHLFMLNKEGHSPLDIAIFNSNTGFANLR